MANLSSSFESHTRGVYGGAEGTELVSAFHAQMPQTKPQVGAVATSDFGTTAAGINSGGVGASWVWIFAISQISVLALTVALVLVAKPSPFTDHTKSAEQPVGSMEQIQALTSVLKETIRFMGEQQKELNGMRGELNKMNNRLTNSEPGVRKRHETY